MDLMTIDKGLECIEKRRSVLGGVVLSGGEPTLYNELPDLIQRIKNLGFLVKLDTNGMAPVMLEIIFQQQETMPDYIALDLKLAPWRYKSLTNHQEDSGTKLEKSAALIREAGIPHEFRTLVFPHAFVTGQDIAELAPLVDDAPWYFRQFRPGNCLDPAWDLFEITGLNEVEVLAQRAKELGKNGVFRKFPRLFPAFSPL
jgi:pyruvate formate lyase activating enzyme